MFVLPQKSLSNTAALYFERKFNCFIYIFVTQITGTYRMKVIIYIIALSGAYYRLGRINGL